MEKKKRLMLKITETNAQNYREKNMDHNINNHDKAEIQNKRKKRQKITKCKQKAIYLKYA